MFYVHNNKTILQQRVPNIYVIYTIYAYTQSSSTDCSLRFLSILLPIVKLARINAVGLEPIIADAVGIGIIRFAFGFKVSLRTWCFAFIACFLEWICTCWLSWLLPWSFLLSMNFLLSWSLFLLWTFLKSWALLRSLSLLRPWSLLLFERIAVCIICLVLTFDKHLLFSERIFRVVLVGNLLLYLRLLFFELFLFGWRCPIRCSQRPIRFIRSLHYLLTFSNLLSFSRYFTRCCFFLLDKFWIILPLILNWNWSCCTWCCDCSCSCRFSF